MNSNGEELEYGWKQASFNGDKNDNALTEKEAWQEQNMK